MLFESILIGASIVGLYESWSYLNGANIENYSQVDFTGFALLMISGTMFAIGFIYFLVDMGQLFRGRRGD